MDENRVKTEKPPQSRHSKLKIWQQNVNSLQKAHKDLLQDISPNHYHILAIQELYTNNFGIMRGNQGWFAIYPTPHVQDPNASRSIMLISTKIPSDRFCQIPVDNKDITTVEIQMEDGPMRIYNIYNDCNNSLALEALNLHLIDIQTTDATTVEDSPMIWVGNFNRHHPIWDELRNDHLFTSTNLNKAETLIDLLAEHDMEMALPAELPTLKAFSTGNLMQADIVFCSANILPAITHCTTSPHRRPIKTDHYPIYTQLDLNLIQLTCPQRKYNYCITDWTEFRKCLERHLFGTQYLQPTRIRTQEEFDFTLDQVMRAIMAATTETVSLYRPTPFTRR